MKFVRPAWIAAAAWLAAAVAAAASAEAADCGALASLRWLLGDWKADGGKTSFHESWRELDPQTLSGAGIERASPGGTVRGAEDLRLVAMGGDVFYVSKVSHAAPSVLADEDARFAAMVSADATAMDSWFAADLHYVHSTGLVEDRAQLIESIASGRAKYIAVTPVEREVVGLGTESALVRGRGRFQVAANGVPIDLQIRYIAVYGLKDGRWRLRSWQSLRIP